jgi:uncharacterized membrane protein
VWALLAVGLLALIVAAVLIVKDRPAWPAIAGYAVAAVLWLLALIVFWQSRRWFNSHGHDIAAVSMFVFILGVVAINALGYREKSARKGPASLRNRYAAVFVAMAVSAVAIWLAGLGGWRYWILALEAVLIALFAVFWVIQTVELWVPGLRAGQEAGSSLAIAKWRERRAVRTR